MLLNWYVTKTEMSQKLKYQKTKIRAKTEMSKTEMLPKFKCQPNWNVTKTEMSSKLKYHQN